MKVFSSSPLILSALLLTLGSSVSYGSVNFSGLYVSLGLGGLWEKGKHQFGDPNTGKGQAKINAFAPAVSLNLGYVTELNLSTFMVGGELYYFYPGFSKRINLIPDGFSSQGNARIQRDGSYGAALIGGKLVNPKTMVYAKIAYDIAPTQFKYSNLTFGSSPQRTFKKSFRTFTPGVGFRYAFSKTFHLGAEYNIANLGKYIIRKGSESIDGAFRQMDVKLLEQRLLFTLTYQLS